MIGYVGLGKHGLKWSSASDVAALAPRGLMRADGVETCARERIEFHDIDVQSGSLEKGAHVSRGSGSDNTRACTCETYDNQNRSFCIGPGE